MMSSLRDGEKKPIPSGWRQKGIFEVHVFLTTQAASLNKKTQGRFEPFRWR
jgi:hypothetical protein